MDHGRHTYLTFRNILIYVVLLWSGMTVNAQSGKGSFAGDRKSTRLNSSHAT